MSAMDYNNDPDNDKGTSADKEEEEEGFIDQTMSVHTQHCSDDPIIPPRRSNEKDLKLCSCISDYKLKYLFDYSQNDETENDFPISFFIPKAFLPISLQLLYGFDVNKNALKITISKVPQGNDYKYHIKVEQPNFGESFTGSNLVNNVIRDFENDAFRPKEYYRSAPLVLRNRRCQPYSISADKMERAGYDRLQSENALSNCHNDIDKSIHLIRTGEYSYPKEEMKVSNFVTYELNPIIYLVLDILDKIFDLQDHCSICGDPIPRCLKPTICEKNLCYTQYSSIGLSTSLVQEIKRDIKVADLLFSVFVSSIGTRFLIPAPPPLTPEKLNEKIECDGKQTYKGNKGEVLNYDPDNLREVVKKVPSFNEIAAYTDDASLSNKIGHEVFKLLQWVILTNRAQLFWLPPSLELEQIHKASNNCIQFMSLASSREQESIFQQLKAKNNNSSIFLWHGSDVDKWHSIIRNGLVNTSRIEGMILHGAAYGPGIYLAQSSRTSLDYVNGANLWPKSSLGKISIIALCEVVKLPYNEEQEIEVDVKNKNTGKMEKKVLTGHLNEKNGIFTLTMEEALIVRFLFVNFNGCLEFLNNPPTNIPTFDDFFNYQMNELINNKCKFNNDLLK